MAIKEEAMLIFTDAKENNNKFYELKLHEDGMLELRWGRVGAEGQKKTSYGGQGEFNRTLNAKLAKGYVRSQTVSIKAGGASQSKVALAEAAKRDMLGDILSTDSNALVMVKLIERLTEMNRHQIVAASNGNINIDDSGLITTPLGLVTASTIVDARKLLNTIDKYVQKNQFTADKYIEALEQYLKLIPQKVPSRRGWYENFFTEFSSLTSQGTLLDQLESSLDLYKSKEQEILKKAAQDNKIIDKVFSTRLEIVTNAKVLKNIEKFFNENKNAKHVSSHLKLKNVFELKDENKLSTFEKYAKSVGNVQSLWHGTRAFNVLSILKNGLIVPKSGGSYNITGRMYGDGLYFSDQSTKSLNYSYGYWDGGPRDNNCFMFIADVAMGKMFEPVGYRGANIYPMKGYDSTFAKAGVGGVMNNEMIVYNIEQACLRYLCEFG
jgi:poly [ADP-ribose] polymerase 2/3/4